MLYNKVKTRYYLQGLLLAGEEKDSSLKELVPVWAVMPT